MKRIFIVILILLGVMSPIFCLDIAYADDPVRVFPDANLEAAVRVEVGVPTGDIHQSDLDLVTSLDANTLDIIDLSGMEYWTSLTELNLNSNRICDVSNLSSLTSLINLYIYGNMITNISPLSSLTLLDVLNIGNNSVTNISCLVGVLDSGDFLDVRNNFLNDNAYDIDIPELESDGVLVNCGISYILSESCFSYGGNDYSGYSPSGARFYYVSSGNIYNVSTSWNIFNIDNDIDCGLYSIGGVVFYTVWYEHGYKAVAESLLSGYGAVCDEYAEGLFVSVNGSYEYQGDPDGWSVIGYDPPILSERDPMRSFLDSNLEIAVRSAVGVPCGHIHQSDLDGFSSFDGSYLLGGISNLSGMEYWTSLTDLDLSSNSIVDISPLSTLTSLISLTLYSNNLIDPSPLSSLTSLTYLDLSYNWIDSVSTLSGLTNLTHLDLNCNFEDIDVSPLSSLTSLEYLGLYYNYIVDVSSLSSLTNLEWLLLDWNNITDITSLAGVLSPGAQLDITNNALNEDSYGVLYDMEAIGVICSYDPDPFSPIRNFAFNDVNLISAVQGATSKTWFRQSDLDLITSFSSPFAGIVDLTGMEYWTTLTSLDLQVNNIEDISPLSSLVSLNILALVTNGIFDVTPLSALTSLNILALDNNSIVDISAIAMTEGELSITNNPLETAACSTYIPALQDLGVIVYYDPCPTPTPTLSCSDICYIGNPSGWTIVDGYEEPSLICAGEDEYVISDSLFLFGGVNYNTSFSWNDDFVGELIFNEHDAINLICGLYTSDPGGGVFYNYSVWYPSDEKSNYEYFLTSRGAVWTCNAYSGILFKQCSDNGTVEDLTNIIPIVFAAILIVTIVASMMMGLSIGIIFYIAITAVIGLALLGVISSVVAGIW